MEEKEEQAQREEHVEVQSSGTEALQRIAVRNWYKGLMLTAEV